MNVVPEVEKNLVAGLGESGYQAAMALVRAELPVKVIDSRSEEELGNPEFAEDLRNAGVELEFGLCLQTEPKQQQYFSQTQKLIVSPGVAWDSGFLKAARKAGVEVVGELEWALLQLPQKKIVITGSNGKTTTASLAAHLLSCSEHAVHLVGNCGVAVSTLINNVAVKPDDLLVVEASSYQLEASSSFVPDVGVFLNISQNHLERHRSMQRYVAAKFKPFRRMESGTLVVGSALYEDAICQEFFPELKCHVETFLNAAEVGLSSVSLKKRNIEISFSEASLIGRHNRENIAAALLAIDALDIAVEKKVLERALGTFRSPEHRIEVVVGAGALWINDSKSTTPVATMVALRAVAETWPERQIYLMVGGELKDSPWDEVWGYAESLGKQLGLVGCFGAGADELGAQLEAIKLPYAKYKRVADAVSGLRKYASQGAAILFSPGAASFDEFQNFEKRGEYFKKNVLAL